MKLCQRSAALRRAKRGSSRSCLPSWRRVRRVGSVVGRRQTKPNARPRPRPRALRALDSVGRRLGRATHARPRRLGRPLRRRTRRVLARPAVAARRAIPRCDPRGAARARELAAVPLRGPEAFGSYSLMLRHPVLTRSVISIAGTSTRRCATSSTRARRCSNRCAAPLPPPLSRCAPPALRARSWRRIGAGELSTAGNGTPTEVLAQSARGCDRERRRRPEGHDARALSMFLLTLVAF